MGDFCLVAARPTYFIPKTRFWYQTRYRFHSLICFGLWAVGKKHTMSYHLNIWKISVEVAIDQQSLWATPRKSSNYSINLHSLANSAPELTNYYPLHFLVIWMSWKVTDINNPQSTCILRSTARARLWVAANCQVKFTSDEPNIRLRSSNTAESSRIRR